MDELMECEHSEQASAMMSLSLDGMLDAAGEHRLQRHLAACPVCQAEWQAMQRISTMLGESPMVGPPLGFAIRVERRLDERARKERRVFGGMAVLTSSLSLAGITVAALMVIVLGLVAWYSVGSLDALQQGSSALPQVASGLGLMGKGASLFLKDLLLRYGLPLVFLVGAGLAFLIGIWAWLFSRRSSNFHRNGFV
jgi:predicted anti-sigma-YlaC factor YlaD